MTYKNNFPDYLERTTYLKFKGKCNTVFLINKVLQVLQAINYFFKTSSMKFVALSVRLEPLKLSFKPNLSIISTTLAPEAQNGLKNKSVKSPVRCLISCNKVNKILHVLHVLHTRAQQYFKKILSPF